ncbi:MAG: DUF2513 domain-containing protein [Acidobacteriaceae bacterium]
MKRDTDLVRKIVMESESLRPDWPHPFEVAGYSPEEVCYHVRLAQDLGLLEATWVPDETNCCVFRLTNEGHNFLETIKDDTCWHRCKEKLLGVTGFLTRETIKAMISNAHLE